MIVGKGVLEPAVAGRREADEDFAPEMAVVPIPGIVAGHEDGERRVLLGALQSYAGYFRQHEAQRARIGHDG